MFRKKLFKMISFVSMFALSFSSSVVYAQEIEPVIVESGVDPIRHREVASNA